MSCFGKFSRDTDHRRVPEPPAQNDAGTMRVQRALRVLTTAWDDAIISSSLIQHICNPYDSFQSNPPPMLLAVPCGGSVSGTRSAKFSFACENTLARRSPLPMPVRRDFVDRQFGFGQEAARHGKAFVQQKTRWRDAHFHLEAAQEVAFAHRRELRGVRQSKSIAGSFSCSQRAAARTLSPGVSAPSSLRSGARFEHESASRRSATVRAAAAPRSRLIISERAAHRLRDDRRRRRPARSDAAFSPIRRAMHSAPLASGT